MWLSLSALMSVASCKGPASKTTSPPTLSTAAAASPKVAGPSSTPLTKADADAAAAKLASLLPDTIGPFRAEAPATTSVYLPESAVSAARRYTSATRKLTAELKTGNISSERRILATDEEHAFLSDTPTYWRTVMVKGHRARIEENPVGVSRSKVYVLVSASVVTELVVAPLAVAGESATLAEALDFPAIEASGVSVPAPPDAPERR